MLVTMILILVRSWLSEDDNSHDEYDDDRLDSRSSYETEIYKHTLLSLDDGNEQIKTRYKS